MKKEKIPVAAEGYPFIGLPALISLVAAALELPVVSLPALLCTGFCLYFFRDPERIRPEEEGAVVAPADGRIILVEKSREEPFSGEETWKISIFMNVFNVHVNRIPFAGRVKSVSFSPGRFYSADTERGGLENERCSLVIDTDRGYSYTMVQIAGLVARRIVCRAEPGDSVLSAQRFGLIRFGSRVDLYLPADTRVQVKKDQKVKAGETTLGVLGS